MIEVDLWTLVLCIQDWLTSPSASSQHQSNSQKLLFYFLFFFFEKSRSLKVQILIEKKPPASGCSLGDCKRALYSTQSEELQSIKSEKRSFSG